jgi:Winged helix DNA-binding domain
MSERLSLGRARSLWWERQGLGDDALAEDVARAIGVTGWLRTLSGADVYIAARARCPGMKRAELDAAVTRGDLRVIPAVRGCIYLVPARFVADLFALNATSWRKQTETDLAKANAKFSVVESTANIVLDVLTAPMTTDAIRKALPKGSIPSFGDAGKKVGLSSPLPIALRFLELDGRIERTVDNGRLDSDRYLWRRAQWKVPAAATTEAAQLANVVKAFLDFAGPSTLAHIAAWSGRAQRDLEPVLAALGAEPVTVDGLGPAFAQRGDIDCAHEAMLPLGLRLLAFEDNYLVNHGGLAVVTDPKHHAIEIAIWGDAKPEAIGAANHVLSRTIVVDGLVVGFWEVDPRAEAAVWTTFDPQTPAVVAKIEAATAELATFLLEDVGNCTVYAQDNIEGVQTRADKIRAMAGKQKRGRAA